MLLHKRTGILLINLGTPAAPTKKAVRKYLSHFLSDPRVIELPAILRFLLLKLVILPFRSKKSAAAYASIWQANGSPLLINSMQIQLELQQALQDDYVVELGMRYGEPSIEQALNKLFAANISNLVVLPLFPQYASSANGSALEQTLKIIAKYKVIVPFKVISDFAEHPAYIKATATLIQPFLETNYDFILMSYHGLPEQQMINPGVSCYRTKCLKTSELIAYNLRLPKDKYAVSFQSRLGRLPWIKPYTDEILIELRNKDIKRLIVVCPSFVADCLETLEEIGIRAKEQWLELGGEDLQLIPCLNAHPAWIQALQCIVKD